MSALLLLLLTLAQSPASVTVPQLSQTQRAGAAQVEGDASTTGRGRTELGATSQVGEGRRSVDAAPALSTAAQGRAVGVGAVGGRDRCDAGSPAADTEICRRRIETRSGEYGVTTAAPVTAEGRLLLLTRPDSAPMTTDSATRRLGGSAAQVEELAGTAANQLAAAIAQQPRPDVVPSGGQPSASPVSGVLQPGSAPVVTTPR